MKRQSSFIMLVLLLLLFAPDVRAQEKISAAVASNFISAFKEIAAVFEAKHGIKIEATFSSTGNLYSQIRNGAPYELFLSADEQRPALLKKEGLTEKIFVYARGQAILWSADKDFCRAATWQDAMKTDRIRKIAIANPLTAPYGASAKTALQKTGRWDSLQGRFVYAQDIAQAFQYATTSAVVASFCALSAAVSPQGRSGCFYHIPEAPDIVQAACILKRAANRAAVEKFTSFLESTDAQRIREKYGYR